MTFNEVESSVDSANEFYLFEFQVGENDFYRYTNLAREYLDAGAGVTYVPRAITCGAFKVSGRLDDITLDVKLPADDDLPGLFADWPVSYDATVVVRRGHVGEAELRAVFQGELLACSFDDDEGTATLSCEPAVSSLRRAGLRRRVSVPCAYVLFDTSTCKANKAAATVSGTVTGVGGNVISLDPGWSGSFAPAKYANGFASWTNEDSGLREVRRILSATADSITLEGVVRGISTSPGVIDITRGCNRQESGCIEHDNLANYGGFPLLTTTNPFDFVNLFY